MGYSTSILTAISQIPLTIEEWIQKEIDNGILNDVETFITSYQNEMELETPTIWLNQHEWAGYKDEALTNKYKVIVPIEFACIEYDNDLKEGEIKAMNLTGRLIASILKHFRRYKKKNEFFQMIKINFKTLYPNGTLGIENKQEIVSVAGVLLEFIILIDWMQCLSINEDTNTEDIFNLNNPDITYTEIIKNNTNNGDDT